MTPLRTASATGPHLVLDEDVFRAHFDLYPFKLRHRLVDHPLLQLPRLVQLSQEMTHPILYIRGDNAINQVPDDGPESDARNRTFHHRRLPKPELTSVEAIARIETSNTWMQLRDVGIYPGYDALLADLVEQLRPLAERTAPGLDAPRIDIFVSSPGATTPFHLDEEHNFLFQIRGSKRLSIANGFDLESVDGQMLREFFEHNGELARYQAQHESQAVHVDLSPGEGVHVPPCHPHWVKNGPEPSISLGILWYSDVTAKRRYLFRINRWLKRLGLPTSNPGQNEARDALLAAPVTIKRRLKRARRACLGALGFATG